MTRLLTQRRALLASALAPLVIRPAAAARPELPRVARRLAAGEPVHIIAFGSSSTEGAGASSPANNYPTRLEADLRAMLPGRAITVANRGRGGEDVDDMLVRLPAIIAEQPDLVIWQTGTNDPLRAVKLDHFAELTRQGVAMMRAAGIDVMLMGPQYCRRLQDSNGAEPFRDTLRAISRDTGVPLVRRYTLMREWLARHELTEAAMLAPDGLHMADAGYAMLAAEVARVIRRDSMANARVFAAHG